MLVFAMVPWSSTVMSVSYVKARGFAYVNSTPSGNLSPSLRPAMSSGPLSKKVRMSKVAERVTDGGSLFWKKSSF